jgi:hypothetical protein
VSTACAVNKDVSNLTIASRSAGVNALLAAA